MKKKRKVGRRSFAVPGVESMTDADPVAPATKPNGAAPEKKPIDELSEELTRMVKAAYQ